MPTAAPYRFLLAVAAALALGAPAPAANKDSVKITGATVGFRAAARDADPVAKFGAAAPVAVTLQVQSAVDEPAELVIEAPDADEVNAVLAVPLGIAGVAPGTSVSVMGYVRPAAASGEVTITVRAKSGAPLSESFRVRVKPREPLQYVVLSIGGVPNGFELPKGATAAGGADPGPLRNGRVELAHAATVADLPNHWFGYESADLVILHTAPELLEQLFAPATSPKRDALFEWVRRGGRLVISVGANAKRASELPNFQALLPYTIDTKAPQRRPKEGAAVLYWSAAGTANTTLTGVIGGKGEPLVLANLVAGAQPARVLIPPPARRADAPDPVAVQQALGIGRLTVIGFDLDTAQFTDPQVRADFWDWVLRDGGAYRASAGGDGKARPAGALTEDEDEVAVALRAHNDTFDGVAVVSFGWIAVLIILYILLIGPVEYYFLKRVLGRLELTWVTFPIIVLTVSAAAYLSADAVKGRELKVNKIDIVDVDAHSNRVYGTTQFTVFSPKIDTYTVGVTPDADWNHHSDRFDTTAHALGAPRGGKPGIVRRKYTVGGTDRDLGSELSGVPIQVWSTKAFAANWAHDFVWVEGKRAKPFVKLESGLSHPPGDTARVLGSFTHHFPLPPLTDCVAFYAGQAYPLPGGVIVRGEPVRLMLDQGTQATQWLQLNGQLDALLNNAQSYRDRPGQKAGQKAQPNQQVLGPSGPLPLWGLLFHEAALKNEDGAFARNASLRRLDQSWRLHADNRDEVIIVGRAVTPVGPAESVLTGAPSLLSLKGQPGSADRWKIPGTARQETWVRFYLPVK
jgi:hypothetical protein